MSEVSQVVEKVVSASLTGADLSRVFSKPTLDSAGDAALHVTIVLRNENVDHIRGDALIDTLTGIIRRLQEAGDDRFPILSYATEEELAEDDDSES